MNETKAEEHIAGDRGDYASGAFVLAMAGFGWIVIGLSVLKPFSIIVFLPALVVFAFLLAGAQGLQRAMRDLPPKSPVPEAERAVSRATLFEIGAILASLFVANLLHRPAWIMPLIALAVGLHFFLLAHGLRRPLYYVTGGALCAVTVGVPSLVPPAIGLHHVPGWQLATGLSSGMIVWLTALRLLASARICLRDS